MVFGQLEGLLLEGCIRLHEATYWQSANMASNIGPCRAARAHLPLLSLGKKFAEMKIGRIFRKEIEAGGLLLFLPLLKLLCMAFIFRWTNNNQLLPVDNHASRSSQKLPNGSFWALHCCIAAILQYCNAIVQ